MEDYFNDFSDGTGKLYLKEIGNIVDSIRDLRMIKLEFSVRKKYDVFLKQKDISQN